MITFLVLVVVLGVVLYLVEQYLPMAPPFKVVARLVVVLILIFALLDLLGLLGDGRLVLR